MTSRIRSGLLVGLAALGLAGASHATITVYTSLAAFNAATTSQGTDTFAGFSTTSTTPSPVVRVAGPYGYTAAASSSTFFGANTPADPWLSTNLATDSIVFNAFTGGVTAIGGNFFASDITGSFLAGDVTLVATDGSGSVMQTITGATVSSFLGFVSDGSMISLTLTAVQGPSPTWPTADNLVLAGPGTTACCDPVTGACSVVPPATLCPGGTVNAVPAAFACSPQPCPQPTACCDTTTGMCSVALPGAACNPGSVPGAQASTSCTAGLCPQPTACCDTTTGACTVAISGAACGAGTLPTMSASCTAGLCPQPTACCDTTTGACTVALPSAACPAGSIPSAPASTSCTAGLCPQPTACCNVITGACSVALPSAACPALTIAATPAISTCSPYPCTAVLMSAAATALLCTDCTYVNGPFDGRDGQLSHQGGASPHGSKAADDLFLCENFVYDLKTFSATIFTTTFPGLVKPIGEIWSDCGGCPGDRLYVFSNPLVIETGAVLPSPAFDGRPLRIVNVTFDVTRETTLVNKNVVLKGGRYWISIYGQSDNLGPSMQMFDVTYWGTTAPPVKGKPAHKIDGVPGLPYNQFAYANGCGPNSWHSVADDCCIGCTDLNFSFCTTPCKVLVDNGAARVQTGGLPNGSTSQFAPASWSAAETRSADDFSVPPCQDYRICYVEACVLTNCTTFDGVFELYDNNCNKPAYALHGTPLFNAQYVATKVIPLGPAYQSLLDGKIVQGYRLEFHDLNITLAGGRQYWISAGVRYTFSINERAFFCYNSYCDARCPIHWNEGRVLTATTLDHEARVAGCVSPAPVVGCNGWAQTGNDMSFLIAADGLTSPGPINGGPTDPAPACRVDINTDGHLDVQDVFDYLNAWFSGCP